MANRRDFIKVSALTTTGVLLAGGYAKKAIAGEETKAYKLASDLKRTPTYCEVCFWKCAGWVHKNEDGNIQKIIGNDDDPACNGRFCPRGTGGVGMYYDEDRLKNPMMRVTGEDGKQTFKEVSWDEALDFVAKKMQKIKKEHGPECTALLTHGSGGTYFGKVLKAFGSNNIAAPSYAQCRGPREVAFISTFGEGLNSPEPTDIRDTKCLVLIGSHLGENMHNGQVQEMSDAIDRGASIITVDPRFSTVASKSKFWLSIKPSTDMALLLTWINLIIENEWYDKEYVEKNTYGFDLLKSEVKKYTPEWAYGITTIKPEDIRKTAKEMHDAAPAVIIHPGRHVTWYGDDTQRLRAVAILNTLLGSWGRRGGFYRTEKKSVKHYPTPPNPKPSRTWRDAMGGKYELADLALANGVCDATIPSATMDCHIKAWIVNGTNLIKTLPDRRQTLKAIQALDLMVVVDTMPMEITGYADVILPECTYLERYDSIRSLQGRQASVALRMPAVEKKYNTQSAWWMAKQLANKLDLGEYFPFETQAEELDWEFKQIGTSLEEMQRIGVKLYDREFDDLYYAPGEEVEYNTNTGKIELYSTALAEGGFDGIPKFTKHEEPAAGFYRLIYGRAPMHTFSRTANNPNLVDLMDENTCWINPKVAKEWGIENEQPIWLENQDGIITEFPIKARITERIRFDSIYMVHGFGHSNKKLSRTYGKGASDSELITKVHIDPIMGGTGMRGNFVTFRFDNAKKVES